MYSILNDIKSKQLKRVYLLFGDEQFLVSLYKNRLVFACLGKTVQELEGDMNFTGFSGAGNNLLAVSECITTLPFFAEKRVVLLQNTGWFKKPPEGLKEVIDSIPETTCVIIAETDVDKRTAAFKAVEKAGHVAEFEFQKEEDLRKWICRNVDENGKKITVKAVDTLIKASGSNMAILQTELEKLYSYCAEKEAIDKTDVDALVHTRVSDRVFDMIAFMAAGKRNEALRLYADLIELREPPIKILGTMEWQFRVLIAVKDLKKYGGNAKSIAGKIGIAPYAAQKSLELVEYFSHEDLVAALRKTAEYDIAIKRGGIPDRMAVELLLVEFSGE